MDENTKYHLETLVFPARLNLFLFGFALYQLRVLLLRYLTAAGRTFGKTATWTFGLIWFTAQLTSLYLPAFSANRR